MKYFIAALSILLFNMSFGQVTFITMPIDKQLFGRDTISNLGHIIIKGEVNNSAVNYDSIQIELFRNNVLHSTIFQKLNYVSNIASFDFDIPILAELANYSLHLYGKSGNVLSLEKVVQDIVAGDVYIIQGQSNAVAKMKNGSTSGLHNNFIRVYANGIRDSTNLIKNNEWYIGQGDGTISTQGNTGQWGLKIAKHIVDSLKIPVAIFNGANGAEPISYFQAPINYQSSQSSNYGRLYYRLDITGLKDFVRAVFWSQGETNSNTNHATSTVDYKNAFITLKNSWLSDYPSIEKIYLFQTKNGCNNPIENLMQIKEAQRQIAYENLNIIIMSTAAITHHSDNCHFPFTNGYELFADRIFPLIQRDLYGIAISNEIEPPMIIDAYLVADTTLIVETNANSLTIDTIAEDFELSNAGTATINYISVSQNKIIFSLSENPGTVAEISYLAQYSGFGNFITNTMGLELVCFNKYPIRILNTSSINELSNENVIVYPNPTEDLLFVTLPVGENQVEITLIDLLGKKVLNERHDSNNFEINLPNIKGTYFLKIETQNNIFTKKILKR